MESQENPKQVEKKEEDGDDNVSKDKPSSSMSERMAKFKQLQSRMTTSLEQNRKDLYAEHRRQQVDRRGVAKLERKKQDAEMQLVKEDIEQKGGDFERFRAWDWTVEESEKWDEKMKEKEARKQGVRFSDFSQTANRSYEKDMREFKPDLEAYQRQKQRQSNTNSRLVSPETSSDNNNNNKTLVTYNDQGDLVPVTEASEETQGHEFSKTIDSLDFIKNRPTKEQQDRLVKLLDKNEQDRLRKRKPDHREEEDVTYINERNRNFNRKLSRAYDKYTKEIRDSFERGTAL